MLAAAASLALACSTLPQVVHPRDDRDDIAALPEASTPPPEADRQVPLDDGSDWIQLKSGEWLRGEVLRLRRGQLVFDSEALGEQSLEFDSLRHVRTAAPKVVVTKQGRTVRGHLIVDGDRVWIEGERTVSIPRKSVLAAIALHGERAVEWSRELTLGAATRSGNTEQDDLSILGRLQRSTAQTRWRTTYSGALGRAQQSETANNHRLRSVYDVSLSERTFVTIPSVDVYRDRFQNIDYRATTSVSVGYQLLAAPRHDLRVSAGPAFQLTRLRATLPGVDPSERTAAVQALGAYTWDVTSNVDLSASYSIVAPVPDTQEFNHNLVLTLSVDLVADLHLDVTFVWDRVNQPLADGDGIVPRQDDYRTTVGLGWSF